MSSSPEKIISASTREQWRSWLAKNHNKENKIALLIHKKHTGKPALSHREAMEEAICFGWIDTTIKRIDEDTFIRRFARRTDKSKWSDNTLSYAKLLVAQGKMVPAGLQRYEEGLKKPTHDHGIPKNPDMPSELKKELAKDKIARDNFAQFSPSVKRTFYRWFLRAKGAETKEKRVKAIVELARKKQKLGA